MTITNASFTMVTTTGKGGAIANAGTLTVNDAEFTYTQDNAGSDLGGAIWNAASGTLTMTDCSWLNSNAGEKGGALYTEGAATIVGASMRHCDADNGGAIYVGATGALTVTASWMQDNTARTNAGGAICSEGSLTVRDSTFMNNASSMDGGAILVEYGSVADIRRSTVAYNSTSGCGGGIAVAGTLVLENSTLHANNAGFCGAGLSVSGAAHSAAVIHTTISSSGGGATDGKGLCSYAPTYLANSIVAHSIGGTDCVAPPEWGNTTNGHNLVADGSCWGTSGNPLLLDLREYYGGDIPTQALTEGSPAVDAGDPDDCPATDQRGVARPQGAGCDLGAYEATAPTATTDPASNVAATGAMLRGTVRSPGWPTDVTFEYGLTTDYGATAASPQNPVNALLNTAVSAAVADLEPNRTYHYRIVAENGVGTTIGEDRTFTTLAVAPTVATGAADGLSAEGATIHGTVNAHNSDAAVFFDYGATDQYGESLAGTPDLATGNANTLVHAVLAGLDPNTAYHYRVRATNAVSTTYGDDATFTTAVVPPIVTTLPASGVTSSGATLRATVNARNADTSVTFEYGTTAGYGTTATGTPGVATGLGDTAVSVTLEGLLPNTTYHYRVVGASDGHRLWGRRGVHHRPRPADGGHRGGRHLHGAHVGDRLWHGDRSLCRHRGGLPLWPGHRVWRGGSRRSGDGDGRRGDRGQRAPDGARARGDDPLSGGGREHRGARRGRGPHPGGAPGAAPGGDRGGGRRHPRGGHAPWHGERPQRGDDGLVRVRPDVIVRRRGHGRPRDGVGSGGSRRPGPPRGARAERDLPLPGGGGERHRARRGSG